MSPISSGGSRIPQTREVTDFETKTYYLARFFTENCIKMKEIGPRGVCADTKPLRSANDVYWSQCYNFNDFFLQNFLLPPQLLIECFMLQLIYGVLVPVLILGLIIWLSSIEVRQSRVNSKLSSKYFLAR